MWCEESEGVDGVCFPLQIPLRRRFHCSRVEVSSVGFQRGFRRRRVKKKLSSTITASHCGGAMDVRR